MKIVRVIGDGSAVSIDLNLRFENDNLFVSQCVLKQEYFLLLRLKQTLVCDPETLGRGECRG